MSWKLTLFLAALVPSLVGSAALASRASAHASPHGLQLVWPQGDSSAMPYVLANRGLIVPNVGNQDGPDSAYSLRCNEAYNVNTSAFPVVFFDDQGALVLQSTESVSVTTDRGCSWTDGTGLPDITLGGFAQNPSAPNKLIVTTNVYQSQAQIFSSEDYGRTWSVLATNKMYSPYLQLITSQDGLRLSASGSRYDTVKNNLFPTWALSSDGGKTWTESDVEGDARLPLAYHPTNTQIVFAHAPEPITTADPKDHFVRSEDGGKTFTVIGEYDPITAFTSTPDGAVMWLGTSTGGLWKSTDQGKTFTQDDASEVSGITCLAYHNDQLWVCANFAPNTNGVWYSSDQGQSFTPVLDFTKVATTVMCDAQAEPICHQPWIDWQFEQSTGFTVDAGVPGDDGGLPGDASTNIGAETDASDDSGVSHPDDGKDAGVAKDARVGTTPTTKNGGGGCSLAHGAPTGTSWLWLSGVALLLARRKRRS